MNPKVVATNDGLYVAWTEFSPVGGAADGLTVIKKGLRGSEWVNRHIRSCISPVRAGAACR
jgi:hypothetical protein